MKPDVNEKANAWFNYYCENCNSVLKSGSINDFTVSAAKLAYRASVLRALYENNKLVGFKGLSKEKNTARCKGEKLLAEYLRRVYDKPADFQTLSVDTWDSLCKMYHDNGIYWYKYGNAQKWSNMAVKYFIAILNHYKPEDPKISKLESNCWFPVDGIMVKHIEKDFGVSFNGTWSKCNNRDYFLNYISEVQRKVKSQGTYDTVFEYEMMKW